MALKPPKRRKKKSTKLSPIEKPAPKIIERPPVVRTEPRWGRKSNVLILKEEQMDALVDHLSKTSDLMGPAVREVYDLMRR